MWFRKKDSLGELRLADLLHCAGLDAYNNYKEKGYSADRWNEFRISIARELLKRSYVFYRKS